MSQAEAAQAEDGKTGKVLVHWRVLGASNTVTAVAGDNPPSDLEVFEIWPAFHHRFQPFKGAEWVHTAYEGTNI